MAELLVTYEGPIRLAAFVGLLLVFGLAEAIFPRRRRQLSRRDRWPSAFAIIVLNGMVLRMLVPLATVGLALRLEAAPSGLVPMLGLTGIWAIVLAFILLDFGIWLQHVLAHTIPVLWRFHRMHHSDVDLDVVSGARFHPGEMLLSAAYKLLLVWGIGAPAAAVVLFEVLLSSAALFNHANIALPESVDRWLRYVVVTPDFHRIHHSIDSRETNSNYGFFLPWWDYGFATYRHTPARGQVAMQLGLDFGRTARDARIDQLLIQPLRTPLHDPGYNDDTNRPHPDTKTRHR